MEGLVPENQSECAAIIDAIDWSKTPMGPRDHWPASLRALVPIMLASPFAMRILWGPELVLLYNDAYRPILGPSKHPSAMGRAAAEVFPEAWPVVEPLFRRVYAGESFTQQDLHLPLDRVGYLEECYFTLSYSPLRDDAGRVGGLLGIVSETTERAVAERRLATLRRLARSAAGEGGDEVCHLAMRAFAESRQDVPFALLYLLEERGATARLVDSVGLDAPEMRPARIELAASGTWPLEIARSERRPTTMEIAPRFGAVHAGPWPEPIQKAVVLPLSRPSLEQPYGFLVIGLSPRRAFDEGYRTFVELAAEHVAGALSHAVASEEGKRRARDDLQASDERYRLLFESSPLPMWLFDLETLAFLAVNEAAVRHYGYDREEFARLTIADIRPSEEVAALRTHLSVLEEKDLGSTWRHRKKDGTLILVEMKAHELDVGGRRARLVVVNDVTARKRAEDALRVKDEQLRQVQKLDAVGRLAGGVAHDFNNLLSVILSYSDLIRASLPASDPLRGDVDEIRRAGQRAADLTRQLLTFSRQQVLEPRVLDLNDVLSGMNKMLRRILGEDIDLVSRPAKVLGRVKADPTQIEQVIMNLAVNARDAMPTGGQLTIETADACLDETYALAHLPTKAGPYVMLAVTDTGSGMDKATQARIFEPFFTTKEQGKGTGLGLATVFGIVQQSGGSIWVYSEPAHGTTFKVYLPRVEDEVTAPKATPTLAGLRGTETILLVEDEEQVRVVARGILQRSGYHVIEARSPGEALLHCERHPEAIELLLTDVVMPQMSGPELAKRLRLNRPEMKVLCMSGYTDDSVVRHGVIDSHFAFLQKPLTPESLARRVREVLDAD